MRNFSEKDLGAFPARSAGNRALRDSAIAPAPALRAVAASHPSNPWRGCAAAERQAAGIAKGNSRAENRDQPPYAAAESQADFLLPDLKIWSGRLGREPRGS
jgi:hypothetical protein